MNNFVSSPLYSLPLPLSGGYHQLLTADALEFLTDLHRQFNKTRRQLLHYHAGTGSCSNGTLASSPVDSQARESAWIAAPIPEDLQDRRVELIGPAEWQCLRAGLASGARVYVADLTTGTPVTGEQRLQQQICLRDAIRQMGLGVHQEKQRALSQGHPAENLGSIRPSAVLKVRPREWHTDENHLLIEGEPISGALFDFGLYFFHNAHALISHGSGPYFCLSGLESSREAWLWNEVFEFAERELYLPAGTIKATVLAESPATVAQLDDIIYELRQRIAGLGVGRWEALTSLRNPMDNPTDESGSCSACLSTAFARTYAQLLIQICRQRGIHAIGGLVALPCGETPNPAFTERVTADKAWEAELGFDGTWVDHPAWVSAARTAFDPVLGQFKNQRIRPLSGTRPSLADFFNAGITNVPQQQYS